MKLLELPQAGTPAAFICFSSYLMGMWAPPALLCDLQCSQFHGSFAAEALAETSVFRCSNAAPFLQFRAKESTNPAASYSKEPNRPRTFILSLISTQLCASWRDLSGKPLGTWPRSWTCAARRARTSLLSASEPGASWCATR